MRALDIQHVSRPVIVWPGYRILSDPFGVLYTVLAVPLLLYISLHCLAPLTNLIRRFVFRRRKLAMMSI